MTTVKPAYFKGRPMIFECRIVEPDGRWKRVTMPLDLPGILDYMEGMIEQHGADPTRFECRRIDRPWAVERERVRGLPPHLIFDPKVGDWVSPHAR